MTARLYSSSGKLLKTVSTRSQITKVPKYGRSLFTILTSRPAGFASVRFTVSSVGASPATRLLGTAGVVASAPGAGQWWVRGSVVNSSATTATYVRVLVGIYDSSGRVLDAASGTPSSTTLTPGQSATFSVTFTGVTTAPMATTTRGKAS